MKNKWLIWIVVVILVIGFCLAAVAAGTIYWQSSNRTAFEALAVPVVQIFYPGHGDSIPYGSSIPVGAEAFIEEENSIVLLQLWADGQMIGEMTGEDVMLVGSWGWLPTSMGEHTLVARAYSQDEIEGTALINVNVEELTDADQDGVPDDEDDCPDDIGAPEWNGCPPGGADGGPLSVAWGPAGSEAGDDVSDASVEGDLGDDIPSEDVHVEEVEEVEELPPVAIYGLEFEGLELQTSVGAMDTYCYLTLTTRDLERVPSDVEGNFTEFIAGQWNAADFMAGDRGRSVFIEEDRTLHVEMDCWGHFSALPADPDPRHLGLMTADHGFADWNGTEFTVRGEEGGNWFDFTYRICQGSCEETTLPRPHNLLLFDVAPDYRLRWNWDGDPSVDNTNVGFHVYRDGLPYVTVHDNHPVNEIILPAGDVEPPLCGQEYRFEVRAFRPDPEQLSEVSNFAWSNSPLPCAGDNRIDIHSSGFAPTIPRYTMILDYYYNNSHSERVAIGAMPTIGGALADPTLFSWYAPTVSEGNGMTMSFVDYGGTETITTDGMQLFMLTTAEGGHPGGDLVYLKNVPMPLTWNPGGADLMISELVYPPPAGAMVLKIRNNGTAAVEAWDPAFAFYEIAGGTRNRIVDLDSPAGMWPVTLNPLDSRLVIWPGWTPARIALMSSGQELEVDPDNLVAEISEANNIYEIEIPDVNVTLKTVRILNHGDLDAAGFPGCFAGLNVGVAISGDSIHFDGTGIKQRYPTFLNLLFPHEIGLLVCPPQEFDVTSELLPALGASSCPFICSTYFGIHAQPLFAEGKHIFLPIPPWGDDYCGACDTLAGQTYAPTINKIKVSYTPGDSLPIDIHMSNQGYSSLGGSIVSTVCNFTEDIPPGDMAALPLIDRVITDPGGNCEIVVDIEAYP